MNKLEIGKLLPYGYKTRLLWTSETLKVGRLEWIYVVYEKDDELLNWRTGERGTARYTGYLWFNEWDGWLRETEHPRYNSNDGVYAGLPKGLRKLYDRHEGLVKSLLANGTQTSTKPAQQLAIF